MDDTAEIRAKMFDARLLLGGLDQGMTMQPNSIYAALSVTFQREVREGSKGLWGK
jgi:hypothetical protein